MKKNWYMKHPIIFGILMPAIGIEAACRGVVLEILHR